MSREDGLALLFDQRFQPAVLGQTLKQQIFRGGEGRHLDATHRAKSPRRDCLFPLRFGLGAEPIEDSLAESEKSSIKHEQDQRLNGKAVPQIIDTSRC